jgi:hypothetical protein
MNHRAPLIILALLGTIVVIFLLRGFLFPSPLGTVSGVDISPLAPVQGDLVTITVTATPNSSVPVKVNYSTNLTVTNGVYEILLEGLRVPDPPNSFEVSASGVSDLSVAVHVGVWLLQQARATGGVATVRRDLVPAGSYEVRIFGNASPGVSEVNIKIVASSGVAAGADGKYSYSYDTSAVHAGSLQVVAGGVTRSVAILP